MLSKSFYLERDLDENEDAELIERLRLLPLDLLRDRESDTGRFFGTSLLVL